MDSLLTPTSLPALKLESVLKILKKFDNDDLTEIHLFFKEICRLLKTEKQRSVKNSVPVRTIQTIVSNRVGETTRVSLIGAFAYRPHFPFPIVQAIG